MLKSVQNKEVESSMSKDQMDVKRQELAADHIEEMKEQQRVFEQEKKRLAD
jgi:hypothetical protein